jgi:hypothetical protein
MIKFDIKHKIIVHLAIIDEWVWKLKRKEKKKRGRKKKQSRLVDQSLSHKEDLVKAFGAPLWKIGFGGGWSCMHCLSATTSLTCQRGHCMCQQSLTCSLTLVPLSWIVLDQ